MQKFIVYYCQADEPWMEKVKRLNISRLVTVGYVALIKISNRVKQQSSQKGQTVWLDIEEYRKESGAARRWLGGGALRKHKYAHSASEPCNEQG